MYVRLGDSAGQSVSEALNSVSTILKTAAPTAANIYAASILNPVTGLPQQTTTPATPSGNNTVVLVIGALVVGGVVLALLLKR